MDVKLPKLGEGADSGVVVNVFVKEGDTVAKGQAILELENEKAVASIPSTAAGGALLGPVFVAYPSMGDLAAAKAFAVVILGGLGSIPGATLGGFILALVEELGAGYVSSGYRDAMGFLLIIVILLFRPTGLFARKERVG